jgi:uncharacterized OB-fold protein
MISVGDPVKLSALPLFDATLLTRTGDGLVVIGWRCGRCNRLALGMRRMCPVCGASDGRTTTLLDHGTLETWTTVTTRDGSYMVAYALFRDGVDDQETRVFGPMAAESDDALTIGQSVRLGFGHRVIAGIDSVHHMFLPNDDSDLA